MRAKTPTSSSRSALFGAVLIFATVFLLELLWAMLPIGWALLVSLLAVGAFLVYNRPFLRAAAKSPSEGEKLRRSLFARLVPGTMVLAAAGYLWVNGAAEPGFFDRANAQRLIGVVIFLLVTAWPVVVPVRQGQK